MAAGWPGAACKEAWIEGDVPRGESERQLSVLSSAAMDCMSRGRKGQMAPDRLILWRGSNTRMDGAA